MPAVFTAVVFLLGVSALGDAPDTRDTSQQIAHYFSVHSSSAYFCAGALTLAMGGLIVFAALVAADADAKGAGELASVMRSTATVVAAGVILGMALMYAALGYVVGAEAPDSAKALFELTLVATPLLAVPIAMLVGATGIAVLTRTVGKRWFGILSLVAAAVTAIAAFAWADHGFFSPDVQQQVVFQVFVIWLLVSAFGLRPVRTERAAR